MKDWQKLAVGAGGILSVLGITYLLTHGQKPPAPPQPKQPQLTLTSPYEGATGELQGDSYTAGLIMNYPFSRAEFTAGNWKVTFSAPGYLPKIIEFTIADGEQKTIDSGQLETGTAYVTYHNPYKYARIDFWESGFWQIYPGGGDLTYTHQSGKNTIEIWVIYPFGALQAVTTYHGVFTGVLDIDGHYDSSDLFPDMPKELTIGNFGATWDWVPKSRTWKEVVCTAEISNDTDSPITGRLLNLVAQRAGAAENFVALPPISLQPGGRLPLDFTSNLLLDNQASYLIWLEDQVTGNRSQPVTVNT